MIVYFEDGPIITSEIQHDIGIGGGYFEVDAGTGYTHCRKQLRYIRDNYPFDTKVYTNSLDAFSNFWCWDNEKQAPMIHIRNRDGEWTLISHLTPRALRMGHNLEKLYVNGEFCDIPQ